MSEELKPCPFCGSEAVFSDGWVKYVKCSHCITFLRIHHNDFTKWNTRSDLVGDKRAGIVQGVRACPLCGSFFVVLDIQQRFIMCPECGLHHGLGSLHTGPLEEITASWNKRVWNV